MGGLPDVEKLRREIMPDLPREPKIVQLCSVQEGIGYEERSFTHHIIAIALYDDGTMRYVRANVFGEAQRPIVVDA